MKFSRVSAFFLLFLVVSLALKIGIDPEPGDVSHARVEHELIAMLEQQGYRVSVEQRSWSPLVRGSKPGCNILIAMRDPDGATKDRIADLARPVGPLHYVYRGAITAEPPSLDPMIRGRIVRQIRQFGIRMGRSPVLAVAASPTCDLKQLLWSRLASMP